jgi:hypothetical protein
MAVGFKETGSSGLDGLPTGDQAMQFCRVVTGLKFVA